MRVRDVVDRASITEVWNSLGGEPLRHGRGRGWWRDGDSYSVALHEGKGCWYDHAHGEGGGKLALIANVLGCERRAAIKWLADHENVSLDDDRPLIRDERSRYAQRRSYAKSAAVDLTTWRRDTLRRLRNDRNRHYLSESDNSAVARVLLATGDGSGNEDAWRNIWQHACDDLRADAIDIEIQKLQTATPAELLAMQVSAS